MRVALSRSTPLIAPSNDRGSSTDDVATVVSWDVIHAPRSVAQLSSAMHNSKVSAIRNWIVQAVASHNAAFRRDGVSGALFRPHVLALCGCSGCGKSTAVQLLCDELLVDCLEWSDDMIESDSVVRYYRSDMWEANMRGYGGGGRGAVGGLVDDVSQFAIQSSFPSLDIVESTSSSTHPMPSGAKVSSSAAAALSSSKEERVTRAKVILMHSPPFQDAANADRPGSLFRSFLHPVIVIVSDVGGADDMQFSADRALRLTAEDKACIDFKAIYCTPITPLKVQKVLNKILDNELDAYYRSMSRHRGRYGSGSVVRGVSSSSSSSGLARGAGAPRRPSPEEVQSIAEGCCGDLRHAIIQLQFICHQEFISARGPGVAARSMARGPSLNALLGSAPCANSTAISQIVVPSSSIKRDTSYSSLHGVAKLLHAKLDQRGFMKFDSDLVMERSEFPIDMSLSFLQHNYIEFVRWDNAADSTSSSGDKDLDQLDTLSSGLDLYSEASLYWDIQYSGRNILDRHSGFDRGISDLSSDFPVSYCVSIASRAAAISRYRPDTDHSSNSIFSGAASEFGPSNHIDDEDEAMRIDAQDDEDFEQRRGGARKKLRMSSSSMTGAAPRSLGGRGMLKIMRPLSLDLWRSTVRSRAEALQLREDLLLTPSSDDVSSALNRAAFIPQGPVLNTVISACELFTTVVPLLRAIIHASDCQMQLRREQFSSTAAVQRLPILVVPSGLRQRLRELFQNPRSQLQHQRRWGDLINADELAEPVVDLTDHGGTQKPSRRRIDASVGASGADDELVEDIEECD